MRKFSFFMRRKFIDDSLTAAMRCGEISRDRWFSIWHISFRKMKITDSICESDIGRCILVEIYEGLLTDAKEVEAYAELLQLSRIEKTVRRSKKKGI